MITVIMRACHQNIAEVPLRALEVALFVRRCCGASFRLLVAPHIVLVVAVAISCT